MMSWWWWWWWCHDDNDGDGDGDGDDGDGDGDLFLFISLILQETVFVPMAGQVLHATHPVPRATGEGIAPFPAPVPMGHSATPPMANVNA